MQSVVKNIQKPMRWQSRAKENATSIRAMIQTSNFALCVYKMALSRLSAVVKPGNVKT